ncbi:MAG: hypothetical protein CL609_09500 [Anaerolineaceae bacterium]|jgi:hypothetical protein|nr:hypothetical protein [Anaerolineaceae bacterium]
MAEKRWQTIQVKHCDHVGCDVKLQALVILPPERLPDQPPRVEAHRCSKGLQCSSLTKPTCVWAGTNPNYDPFADAD